MIRRLTGWIAGAAVLAGSVFGVHAEGVRTQSAIVEPVADVRAFAPGIPFRVGVRIRLDPGWHTYWINPGEAGMATSVKWVLPDGFTAGPLQWPFPRRFVSDGIVGFGYEGEVVLFAEIMPPRDWPGGQPAELKAEVDLLLCKEICVPGSAALTWSLRAATEAESDPEGRIALDRAAAEVPRKAGEGSVSASFRDGKIVLRVEQAAGFGVSPPPVFFPEARNLLAVDKDPEWFEREGALEGRFPLSHLARGTPLRLKGVLVPGDGSPGAVQVDVRLAR